MESNWIFEAVEQLVKRYSPDSIHTALPPANVCYSHQQDSIPMHWWLIYGRMTISISCREYSHCDHYNVISGSSFNYNHPYTATCEIGVYDNTNSNYKTGYGWVENDSDNKWHWDGIDTLTDVVRTIYAYAMPTLQVASIQESA